MDIKKEAVREYLVDGIPYRSVGEATGMGKLRTHALVTMITVAERELNIDIRKAWHQTARE